LESKHNSRIEFHLADERTLELALVGDWYLRDGIVALSPIEQQRQEHGDIKRIRITESRIGRWDTSLALFISRLSDWCTANGIELDSAGIPEGVQQLLKMAGEIPAAGTDRKPERAPGIFEQIGLVAQSMVNGLPGNLKFIGEILLSFGRLFTGRARFRMNDLMLIIQQVGPNALPIVSLVSFLVGLILAYMGAAQLERVGVQIYIADLVAIAMVREIGALMTGIIMAGRTGAAFAAELGTMQVNEEIDAYKTLGISIIDFLVMPRVLGLMLMIPLLTLYSGLVGTLAGMVVGISVFDISLFEYWQQTLRALELKQFWVGIGKGAVYGIVVAISGCLRGIRCGRSAQAVGEATTSAVVTSIIYIVITASAMTIVLYKLDI
jgi:phospholipid/cholesterol/gamma-HCH transport system permease protein